jgi:hypothetical protein
VRDDRIHDRGQPLGELLDHPALAQPGEQAHRRTRLDAQLVPVRVGNLLFKFLKFLVKSNL